MKQKEQRYHLYILHGVQEINVHGYWQCNYNSGVGNIAEGFC